MTRPAAPPRRRAAAPRRLARTLLAIIAVASTATLLAVATYRIAAGPPASPPAGTSTSRPPPPDDSPPDPIASSTTVDQPSHPVDHLSAVAHDTVDAPTEDFAARYRAQVGPIGRPLEYRESQYVTSPQRGHGRGASIRIGHHRRPALVNHIVEHNPTAPVFGGNPVRRETFRFVRWLDDDMAIIAGPLEDLDATQVTGLPVAELMRLDPP